MLILGVSGNLYGNPVPDVCLNEAVQQLEHLRENEGFLDQGGDFLTESVVLGETFCIGGAIAAGIPGCLTGIFGAVGASIIVNGLEAVSYYVLTDDLELYVDLVKSSQKFLEDGSRRANLEEHLELLKTEKRIPPSMDVHQLATAVDLGAKSKVICPIDGQIYYREVVPRSLRRFPEVMETRTAQQ